MQCFKNARRNKAKSSLKAFMPLIRSILAVSVFPLRTQLESSGREGKMVKPEGAPGSSASGGAISAPWRHSMGYVWLEKKAEGHCSKFAFTLKCKRNCSSLTVAESRFWHYLPFVALPVIRLKLCSPAEFESPLQLRVRQVFFCLNF